jgi:hypothetical protein
MMTAAHRSVYVAQKGAADGFGRFRLSLDLLCVASLDGHFCGSIRGDPCLGFDEAELRASPFLDSSTDDRAATLAAVSC